jgi:hypothetical protein
MTNTILQISKIENSIPSGIRAFGLDGERYRDDPFD